MQDFLKAIFGTGEFMPHGYCYRWQSDVVWLNVGADILITLAYYSIPLLLLYMVRRRKDLAFHWMFLMFGAFIFLCGTTHLVNVLTVWYPLYRIEGMVKLVTGIVSIITAVLLIKIVPKVLSLRSPAELAAANEKLSLENTQRRLAEEGLQNQTNLLNLILNSMSDGVVVRDPEGKLVLSNPAVTSVVGIRTVPTDLERVGEGQQVYLAGEDTPCPKDSLPMVRALRGEEVRDDQIFLKNETHPDGLWLSCSARPLRNDLGAIQGAVALFRDITERKVAEQKLEQANLQYRTLFNSVPAMIWYKDRDNRILGANEPAARSLGVPLESLPGMHVSELYPEESDAYYRDDLEVMATEEPKLGIIERMQLPGGEKRWIRTDKLPYRDAAGNIIGVIVFAVDITEAIRLEEQHEDLMSALAHDLKVPVIGAQRVFKLLLEGTLGPISSTQCEFLDKLLESNTRMLEMIQTLVDVYKYDKSTDEMFIDNIRMSELIEGSLDELQHAASEKNIRIITRLAPDMVVQGDRMALHRLVNNLLDNAVKFCHEKGAIEIELAAAAGDQMILRVSNEGDPISPDDQRRLFQRFWQGGGSGQHSAGVGLGLYLCRQIVAAHHGTLRCVSEPDTPTTFAVTLPLRQVFQTSSDTAGKDGAARGTITSKPGAGGYGST